MTESEYKGSSQTAQIEYLSTLAKVKDDEIKTLKLQLKTVRLQQELETTQVEKQLEVLADINEHMKKRAIEARVNARVPNEALAWLEYRMLPWYKKIWRKLSRGRK